MSLTSCQCIICDPGIGHAQDQRFAASFDAVFFQYGPQVKVGACRFLRERLWSFP
jgi:hypothetical protein